MPKNDLKLWAEIDGARTQGLIRKLEDVSVRLPNQSHMKLKGTRVWFCVGVTSQQVLRVREYIRQEYNLDVSNETPISLIIWEQPAI